MTGRADRRHATRGRCSTSPLQERVDLDALQRELSGLRARWSPATRRCQRALMSPAVPAAKKRAVVEALFGAGGAVSPLLGKILTLLADRDRLTLLPELAAALRAAPDGSPAGGARRAGDRGGAAGRSRSPR